MVRPPGSGGGRLADVGLGGLGPRRGRERSCAAASTRRRFAPAAAWRCCCSSPPRAIERCVGILASAGEALGFAIANLITLFAPPKVIVAGRAMATSEFFIGPLRETVAALLPPSLADVAEIVVREWSDGIWVRGAAAMTLRDLYGAPWGTTGPAPIREAFGAIRGDIDYAAGRRRNHRLRQHQPGLSEGGEEISDPRNRRALADAQSGRRRGARRASSAFPRGRSTPSSPIPAIEIVLNLTVPRRACRGRPARRSPPASTSIRRSRSASTSPRRGRLVDAAEAQGRAASAARPTRSSAAPIRPRAS